MVILQAFQEFYQGLMHGIAAHSFDIGLLRDEWAAFPSVPA